MPIPTFAGFLLLTCIGCAVLLLVGFATPKFLAMSNPVLRGYLVVEGWLPAESLKVAAMIFKKGHYDAMVVSGGPIMDEYCNAGYKTYADRAADVLRQLGVPKAALIVASAPASAQDRTYRSAVSVRQKFEDFGLQVSAMDVLSAGPHTRRTRNLYQKAFGEHVQVGAIATMPASYDLAHWWSTSAGVKDVITEGIVYIWSLCCFVPGPRGSWQEAWGH